MRKAQRGGGGGGAVQFRPTGPALAPRRGALRLFSRSPHLLSQARALAAVCDEHGTTLPEVAMQFPLRHPAVATVVAGMRNPAQVASDIRFMGADVPESVWPALDEVVTAAVDAG